MQNTRTFALFLVAGVSVVHLATAHGGGSESGEVDQEDDSLKVASAFGYVIAAAAATMVGNLIACAVPVSAYTSSNSSAVAIERVVCSMLGVSGGVLLFVAFTDIRQDGIETLTEGLGKGSGAGSSIGTACFFFGVFAVKLFDFLAMYLRSTPRSAVVDAAEAVAPVDGEACPCCEPLALTLTRTEAGGGPQVELGAGVAPGANKSLSPPRAATATTATSAVVVALSLGVHNLAEGLSIFLSAVSSGRLGPVVAVALILHKIPEGFIISAPLLIANPDSKSKAFLISLSSALSCVLSALVGFGIYKSTHSSLGSNESLAVGVLSCFSSGMMVCLALTQLLVAARKHDVQGNIADTSMIAGMLGIAVVLQIFTFAPEDEE